MISTAKKQSIINDTQRHKKDTGSPEAQASVLTARIKEITEHLKKNKHDFMARRGLLQLVGKRRRLLKYLAETEPDKYLKTIKKLGIRRQV
ncbi:30S ribosomal protein S15 [Candidatus Saccharibacteria bacterium]|jgi:small subunit ribosomal protein S15|nr:30S ribosomal protein S15 [Candidatus Saccharibacteria bacterium]HOR23087.1 30S ribosomal protein S15 [Candidatus Saccharibacteria bacterium]HPW47771.1 30S ribosomal protein S15 [Candidatus Saccharibacteria bacterium]